MSWQFYPQDPKDTINNPIAGEFFSGEAVRDAATALVREALQNSLDARPQNSGVPARVRIHLSEDCGALAAEAVQPWFNGIWPHAHAEGNGLSDRPTQNDGCPYIVIEDFNTTGLEGNPEAYSVDLGSRNNFLSFFRAFGHSDKRAHSKGSWGVGKTVFPRSSRLSGFFGFTVRDSDGRRMLLGRSILKFHEVAGQPFKSDGYFGRPRNDGFVLPFEDDAVIDSFRQAFRLERSVQPGLSVVVPWYHPEGDNAITYDATLQAVASGFFFPILAGDLIVTLSAGSGRNETLDATNLAGVLQARDERWARDLLPSVELALWWRDNAHPGVTLKPPAAKDAQRWNTETIPLDAMRDLLAKYTTGERFVVRVPMAVRPKIGDPKPTWFDLVCEPTGDDTTSTTFIRDGLIIPDVRARPVTRGARCLIIVEQDVLAAFLRDAENPAHTDWSTSTGNFKDKYVWGPAGIEYVKGAFPALLAALRKGDSKPDLTITLDHFFVPAGKDDGRGGGDDTGEDNNNNGESGGGGGKGPSPKPKQFVIAPLAGGFVVRRPPPSLTGSDTEFEPFRLRISTAYDVRSGNPLKSFNENDFNLSDKSFSIDVQGASIRSREKNIMLAEVESADFSISVTGFDTNRDLFVRAVLSRVEDHADTTP